MDSNLSDVKIFFSDYFGISSDVVEEYGAINISLIYDFPLFIDPFLLFNNEDPILHNIHDEMISYLKFIQLKSERINNPSKGMLKSWFVFSEVKQTWLGLSRNGNSGRGLGYDFAKNLYEGLSTILNSFGKELLTKSSHMEKLCLISPRVGRDKISDFTTNFALNYLLEYTEKFARSYIDPSKCRCFNVPRVYFDYTFQKWVSKSFFLPEFNNDFVLLTPKCILTRDDTFINRRDMIDHLSYIAPAVDDETLRFELDNYLTNVLSEENNETDKNNKEKAAELLIRKHPEIIDYYLKYKEDHAQDATSVSIEQVNEVKLLLNNQVKNLVGLLRRNTSFYDLNSDAYDESLARLNFLKHVIEDQDGYRLFYVDGKPIKKESILQILFRLVWFGTAFDVNREVNNGRGPVDYKISSGKYNSSLVEFKLATNSKLKQNLMNQVEIYTQAADTNYSIKAIIYFTESEYKKVTQILTDIGMIGSRDIVLIDARIDNKPSASIAK